MDVERMVKIEQALANIAELKELRVRQMHLLDELRFGLEYEREMLKINRDRDGKFALVRRGHVLSNTVPRRLVEHTRWDDARPEDIVGVKAVDQHHPFFFELPIRPYPGMRSYQSMGYSIFEPKGPIHGFKSKNPQKTSACNTP